MKIIFLDFDGVMDTDILRINHQYPYGNNSATEAILLYWRQMLLYN